MRFFFCHFFFGNLIFKNKCICSYWAHIYWAHTFNIYMYIILRSEKNITSNKASRDCHMKTLIDLSITFYLRHWTGYKIVTYACLLLLLHFFFKSVMNIFHTLNRIFLSWLSWCIWQMQMKNNMKKLCSLIQVIG